MTAVVEAPATVDGNTQRGDTRAVVCLQQQLLITAAALAVGVEAAEHAGDLVAVDQQAQALGLLDLQLLGERLGGEVGHRQVDGLRLLAAIGRLGAAVLFGPLREGAGVIAGQLEAQLAGELLDEQAGDRRLLGARAGHQGGVEIERHPVVRRLGNNHLRAQLHDAGGSNQEHGDGGHVIHRQGAGADAQGIGQRRRQE